MILFKSNYQVEKDSLEMANWYEFQDSTMNEIWFYWPYILGVFAGLVVLGLLIKRRKNNSSQNNIVDNREVSMISETDGQLNTEDEESTSVNFCTQCGSAVLPGAKFCDQCGAPLVDTL